MHRPSSGQVGVDKYCPQQSQRKTLRDRLLDANNLHSIMETDGKGKFVSFKVVLGCRLHRYSKRITVPPVPIAWCVAFIGAREQLRDSSWWIQGQTSEEKSLKKIFLCDSCCGQNVDLDREEGAGGHTIARSLSCACSFAMSVSARSLPRSGEREGEQSRKSGKRDLLKWTSFVFFFAALQDGGLLEMSCFSFMVPSMTPLANASWPSHFAFPLWSTVYFLVVCLFFPRSHIDFQKKLDEKH